MSKHTPGPWSGPYYDNHPGDRGWWVHNGLEGQDEYAVAVTFTGNPNQEADARLIAAAPDLLEACKLLMEYSGIIEERDGNWATEKARAAIAKAEGES